MLATSNGWQPTLTCAGVATMLASAAILTCLMLQVPVDLLLMTSALAGSTGWALAWLGIHFLISRQRLS
jgi:hypothetical protein